MKIRIKTSGHEYHAIFSGDAGGELRKVLKDRGCRVILVADSNVARLYPDFPAAGIPKFVFRAGESSKTSRTYLELSNAMARAGMGRDSVIIAFGGGVTLDIAGFTAATYMRGIGYLNVPTSLLAMADASIGGKTALNLKSGKNLIGAFHQPSAVIIDAGFLKTLPEREWRNGMAEMVKHAVIADSGYFEDMEKNAGSALKFSDFSYTGWIYRSAGIKAGIVERDEKENGVRAVLNFGHTIGHGLELASGCRIPHGIAVALGMRCESWISSSIGLLPKTEMERIDALLDALKFPRVAAKVNPGSVLDFAGKDKKNRSGAIRFSLPSVIGKMCENNGLWTVEVKEREILRALEKICSA